MFFIGMPVVKAGRAQALMRMGVAGLSGVLALVAMLQEGIVDHAFVIALLIGLSNGAYWFVNHIEGIDRSNNANRASFVSYRRATQGVAKLAVPAFGWLAFSVFSNAEMAYSAIFITGMVCMLTAWFLADIPDRVESKLDIKGSLREFRRTKFFGIKLLNGFLYGLTLRSALSTVLLPFLIFQVVEKESSLNLIQTGVEVSALVATYYFAGHKKNTDYIVKLFLIGSVSTILGVSLLFFSLNIHTYILFVVTYVLALSATSIATGIMSSNYVTTVC